MRTYGLRSAAFEFASSQAESEFNDDGVFSALDIDALR